MRYEDAMEEQQKHQHKESLPAMAFADELFCDALKTVKGERKEKWQKINRTRARPNLNNQLELNGLPTRIWIPNITNASSKRLAESKGVLFARKARLMKIDLEWPREPNKPTLQESMLKAGENAKETGEPSERKSKRQSMKNFLYRSLSTRRNDEHRKQTEQTVEVSKPETKRKLSFKSMGLVVRNGERGGSQITKVTQTRYKPKLSLCMGNGAKYVE
ncbi:hypothetical protein NC652_002861 [Populus alba x Populus x berolinensis]|nr:hypothetical protein NC652_002861 [Populus alba x Populus x berolinensis]